MGIHVIDFFSRTFTCGTMHHFIHSLLLHAHRLANCYIKSFTLRLGQTLVSGGYDKSVVIWEMQNYAKKLVLKVFTSYHHPINFSTRILGNSFFQGHDGWITDVDISRDGKWILSSSKVTFNCAVVLPLSARNTLLILPIMGSF